MNGIIFLLISGISGACILYGLLQSARESGDERLRFWQKAAKSCGLQVVEVSGYLEARAGLINVRIEDARDQERPKSRLVVEGPAPPDFQHVMIRPEPRIRFGREIEIGDLRFDSTFFIVGPARLVLALLDAEVRSLLLATSAEGLLEISYGKLEAVVPDEKVPEVLPLLVDIRKRFIAPMDIPRRLADNVSRDPWAGVRLKNLLLLIRELPDDPATARALRKACSDPNPEIRLRAAKQLGPEGHGTLLKVARDLRDDAVSAEAVSTLDRELPLKRARSILVQALSLNRLRTARACLQVLGHSGAAAAVDPLTKVLASKNIELATAAPQALGETGSPAAEPSLIQALQRDQTDLQVAAASAMGRVGSTAAVLPLKEAAERSRLDLELHRATRQAIAEIQSRLQGASPGQLSLAGGEAGQLSLAQTEAGQLSLAEDPAGQLSIPPGEDPA